MNEEAVEAAERGTGAAGAAGEPAIDPLELPFDQYQRYRLVADIVRELQPEGGRVLDVGGRTALLRSFLTDRPVALVDFETSEAAGLVQGDGSRLPFRDRSFDAVTACDTLEHVPPARREAFARECARVSRGAVVIAGPYERERVDGAEELLADFVRDKLGFRHRYLEEHREHGLPVREDLASVLASTGAQVRSIGHANLERWLALISLELYMDQEPQLRKVARRYFRFYNQALYAADFRPPHYRHAVVAWYGPGSLEERLARFERAPDAEAASAASRALRPFGELLAELVAFDRERDVFEAERARLATVIAGLVQDRDGHRAVAEELRRETEAQRAVIAELRGEVALRLEYGTRLEVELNETNRRCTELNEELRHVAEEHKRLRDLLQDRLGNLRRALSWRRRE